MAILTRKALRISVHSRGNDDELRHIDDHTHRFADTAREWPMILIAGCTTVNVAV
jgi:hypothetical protein